MPVVRRELMIDAPRTAVWSTLADIGAVAEWNPVVEQSEDTSEASAADGAGDGGEIGVDSSRHCDLPGSMGAIDEVVTGWDEHQSMAVQIHGAKMMRLMHARFELADAGSGTRVTMTSDFTMSFGPLGALMAATMGKRMPAGNMEQTLTGLKGHVEVQQMAAAAVETPAAGARPEADSETGSASRADRSQRTRTRRCSGLKTRCGTISMS
jgi:carbon monoxide dehydrogenase subunit G